MPKLNSQAVSIVAGLVFILAVSFSFLFKNYELAVGGLLVVVVLTVFIPGWRATLIAGLASMIVMTVLAIYFRREDDLVRTLLSQVYSLLLILLGLAITFYLKKLQQNLEHGKTHMSSLFENATEGILLTDQAGKIILVNPAAEKMFEYENNELIGQQVELLIPQRFQGGHEKMREGFYKHPRNRSMGSGRDLYARKKDNSEFPVEVSLSHYKQMNESFVIAFIVDITTRKETEQNLLRQKQELEKISSDIRKLNTALEEKVEERTIILKEALQKLELSQQELSASLDKERQLNEIKSRFVSMASHEFRTPLSTILSSATLIPKYPAAEEQRQREKHIHRIKDSVNHLNELLEDFLSLGKLEEGKVGITVTEFSVKDFTGDLVDEMRVQLKQDQLLQFNCTGDLLFITDKRMLKNILINLLANASKFSENGKTIELNISNEHNNLQVTVKDQGLGIPAEDQEYLFTTFFRGKNVANIQGTGLGLPIVKRYVDLLKGTISFESQLNQGTIFRVELPAQEK